MLIKTQLVLGLIVSLEIDYCLMNSNTSYANNVFSFKPLLLWP
jgi:hypothetical protein